MVLLCACLGVCIPSVPPPPFAMADKDEDDVEVATTIDKMQEIKRKRMDELTESGV